MAWAMRCEIREKLIAYLQEHHPESLPRLRAAIESEPSGVGGEADLGPRTVTAKSPGFGLNDRLRPKADLRQRSSFAQSDHL